MMPRTRSRGAHAATHRVPRSAPPARGTRTRGAGDGGAGDGERRFGGSKVAGFSRATLGKLGAAVVVLCVLGFGLVRGGGSSAEPTVQAFLLAWENGHYQSAAGMTTGSATSVADALAGAYRQLDAANLVLSMGRISQQGASATAAFRATVDLGSGGLRWEYRGTFAMRRTGAGWKILWSPSVIVPGLGPGDRLAVLTTMPSRAQLQDTAGRPLAKPSPVYSIGVRPGRLRHPRNTADAVARVTNLDASQVYGQIIAAPSKSYLGLIRLQPGAYARLHGKLASISGLIVVRRTERLFESIAPEIVGSVGTETADVLRQDGVPYRPGATVGLSGLQAAYQHTLTGAPTTEVVLQNAAGRQVAVLQRWPGSQGRAVRTSIDTHVQRAADEALAGLPGSAAIVAISPGTGNILAVAAHQGPHMPAISPLAGQYHPGQAFTIVSTAALLQLQNGFSVASHVPCKAEDTVGGHRFVNRPAETGLGASPRVSADFAHACGTALAGLSIQLNASDLANAAKGFGIGAPWRLDVPSFAGTIGRPVGYGQIADTSVGGGDVRVSPLDMALAAGLVRSGTWHSPALVTRPSQDGLAPRHPFGPKVVSSLRALMRTAVTKGAGQAANVSGGAVYGQVGSSALGGTTKGLRSAWFVGYQGKIAFAVIEFTKSASTSAAPLAGSFLSDVRAES
jgi:cell division protein FtsI/penicillin-binding protein 2